MNENQEVRAKALEIAVLIRGNDSIPGRITGGEKVIRYYLATAEAAEKYIRGDLKSTPAESAERN